MRFANKAVLITGGGTGIGAAVARRIRADGGEVILMGRRKEPLNSVADAIGAIAVRGDAASREDVQGAVALAIDRFGGLDVLVANAGHAGLGKVTEIDDVTWGASIRANLDTAFVSSRECLPLLEQRKGNIVIVSSLAGLFAGPRVASYVTTKHAVIGLTKSIARDFGSAGVRCNAVCPGWVRTDMADLGMEMLVSRHGLPSTEDAYSAVSRNVPLRRPAEPGEISNVICFLASSEAAMVTGALVPVDGGASIVDVPTIAFADT